MTTSTNSNAVISASVQSSAGGNRTVRTRSSARAMMRNEGSMEASTDITSDAVGIDTANDKEPMGPYINVTLPSTRDTNLVPHNTPTSSERKKRTLSIQADTEWSPSPPSKRHLMSYEGEEFDNDLASSATFDCGDQYVEDEYLSKPDVAVVNIAKLLDFQSQAKLDGAQQLDGKTSDLDPQSESLSAGTGTIPVNNNITTPDTNRVRNLPAPRIKTLKPYVFTIPRNVGKWSKSYQDNNTTIYEATYVPSSDPWIDDDAHNSSMDPELADMGLYNDLPTLPILQFIIQPTPPNIDVIEVDENGDTIRHAMTLQAWQEFGLTKADSVRMITFTRNGQNGNPARDSPLHYTARSYNKDSKSRFFKEADAKVQFFAVDRATRQPVVFWSLGTITSVFLSQPCAEPGRAAYRGVHAVLTGWERDRMVAFFSMVFRNTELIAQMDGNSSFVFQTRFQSKYSSTSQPARTTTLDSYTSTSNGLRIGQFSVPAYRAPVKEIVPPAYYNHGYAFSANIPVYDGRDQSFDPMRVDKFIGKLPRFTQELQEGSCTFIGYGAGTNLYDGKWRISFFIRYVVVMSVPDC